MANKYSSVGVAVYLAILGCLTLAQAVTLEVKQGNSTCIKAELSALLTIPYDTVNGTNTAQVSLPNSTTVDVSASSCGADGRAPWLVGIFGAGHTLGLGFSTNGSLYSVVNLSLQYNLSDTSVFPLANSSDVVTLITSSVGILAQVNTTYRCLTATPVPVGEATVTFSGMKLEAYMPGDDLSPNESVCTADQSATTTSPPPATTAAPAPTPPGTPDRGDYAVTNGNNTVCLLARMALQLNVSYVSSSQNKTIQALFNLQPNQTSSSGSCGPTSAILVLMQEQTTNLSFTFTLNITSKRYHLSGLSLSAAWPDMATPVSASNSTLTDLPGTLGMSYMCSAEQVLEVTPAFSLNTFKLQVQPFGLSGDQFATAEECQVDQDNMLIPIIVGAALAGLVLIVLVAYLIGRKRSHAGYQTI
ncbi:lysosome-associated membrane glycoprotein 1a [Osmerus mordax]|uniref:lysosome-associated membrane glycoprotein 1a n=1 Tax=Osmerus mordax TaxID=8014 RepID=UPI0035108245